MRRLRRRRLAALGHRCVAAAGQPVRRSWTATHVGHQAHFEGRRASAGGESQGDQHHRRPLRARSGTRDREDEASRHETIDIAHHQAMRRSGRSPSGKQIGHALEGPPVVDDRDRASRWRRAVGSRRASRPRARASVAARYSQTIAQDQHADADDAAELADPPERRATESAGRCRRRRRRSTPARRATGPRRSATGRAGPATTARSAAPARAASARLAGGLPPVGAGESDGVLGPADAVPPAQRRLAPGVVVPARGIALIDAPPGRDRGEPRRARRDTAPRHGIGRST